MSPRGSALDEQRNQLGAHVWWDAVSSGAFFTRPSLLISALIAMTAMAPFQHFENGGDYFGVVLVGFLGWALLALALLPAAFAERRIRSRRGRGLVVLSSVVVAAAVRPFVNEMLFGVLFGETPIIDDWPSRVISNVVIWVAGLSMIAMTVRSIELTRGTRARLGQAVATLTHGRQRLARFENDNRAVLEEMIGDLRIQREKMLAGAIDFDAVRAYSETVRAASHRLEERAQLSLHLVDAAPAPPSEKAAKVSVLSRLRPPPYLLVGTVFFAATLPYVYGIGGLGAAIGGLLVGLPVTLAADIVSRLLGRGRNATARGVAFLSTWFVAAVLLTALAHLLVEDDLSKLVPIISLPLVAITLAACTDAIVRAAISSRRLQAVLALVARTLTTKTAQARRPLRNAAHVLHGRVQGRCVLLAAYADEWEVSDQQIDTFRSDLDEAFESVLWFEAETDSLGREGIVPSNHEDVSELVATWSAVLDVSTEISDAAAIELGDPAVSRRVATVVNEGFVNAVKHSEAKEVWLSIGVEDGALLVRTWSIGVLDNAAREPASSSRGIGVLGIDARIYQRGDEVVLEVPVPLSTDLPAPIRTRAPRHRRSGLFRKPAPHSHAG